MNERCKMDRARCIKAMEFLVRQLCDESLISVWSSVGVVGGTIKSGDLSTTISDLDSLEYYLDDDSFNELKNLFGRVMKEACNGKR